MGRRMTGKDLAAAKFEQEVWNSMVKRGEIDESLGVRTHYVVCGCGVEGCGFITRWLKTDPWNIDLEQQKFLYQKWLEEHPNERKIAHPGQRSRTVRKPE